MPSEAIVEAPEVTPEQIEGLLAASARHSDLRAVCDFGKLVFGVGILASVPLQWISDEASRPTERDKDQPPFPHLALPHRYP